jgi:hypothetical protein
MLVKKCRRQAIMLRLCRSTAGRLDFLCSHTHFRTNGSSHELKVEMQDDLLTWQRRKASRSRLR